MINPDPANLGDLIKQQRVSVSLTLQQLAARSGVSPSHLGRIERGERFPSARILKRIAGPLSFEENELLTLAGYLSPQPTAAPPAGYGGHLDPHVARILGREPVEVQRAVVSILAILKSVAKNLRPR